MTEERRDPVIRGARFSGGPARAFLSSMETDRQLFEADLAVDRAHSLMLAEVGILSEDEVDVILDGLDRIEAAGFGALPDAEDVHEAIETALIGDIGPVGGKLHTARSRNDEVATCIRYRVRQLVLELAERVMSARGALIDLATAHDETIMPGYTHLQPAQPTTVAHWALSYEQALAREVDRLIESYDRVNRSPLGAAAFAGTPYPIDPAYTAALLGFEAPLSNAMDAVSGRDIALEVIGIAVSLSVTLSGLAEDLIIFANRGYVQLDDDYASTSSIMPQKKNPDTLELVRASAGDSIGAYTAVATVLKGLPRAYNRDLQSVTPHLLGALDAVTEATTVTAGAVATATWEPAALDASATEGISTATDVADHLAMAGIPFREAHALVSEAAAVAAGDLDAFVDAVLDRVGEHSTSVDADTIEVLVDPAASVARRDSLGGPAPVAVAAQLEEARSSHAATQAVVDSLIDALETADEALESEVTRDD